MTRDVFGNPLVPGVNVDPIDLRTGLRTATSLGYDDEISQMVVGYALQCWARGEEDIAQKAWLHEYPNDLTSWLIILAAAIEIGTHQLTKETA